VLVDKGIVHNIADLYKLEEAASWMLLKSFPGFGDKRVYEITKQVKASKKQPLWRVINALGIPHVGDKVSQDIANFLANQQVTSLQQMREVFTDTEKILTIPGIGEKTVLTIQSFFTAPQTWEILQKLERCGIPFSAIREEPTNKKERKGTFAITGIFPFSREQMREQLEKSGYVYHEQPTKQMTFLLAGEKAGGKKQKAEQYGIPIYQEREEIKLHFPELKELESMSSVKMTDKLPVATQKSLF
jgi:DNA ligase (NAD+)